MSLVGAIKKLEAIKTFDALSEVADILNENDEYIVGLLRLQLQEGKDANNENVTVFGRDYYSYETLAKKERISGLGGFTGWITNYETGYFYRSLQAYATKTGFEIDSSVPYFEDIITRSGQVIMQLNQEHLEDLLHEIVEPELGKRFNLYINGL